MRPGARRHNGDDEAHALLKPRTDVPPLVASRCLTFDMSGGLTAQPAGHPLDGVVRQRPARFAHLPAQPQRLTHALHFAALAPKFRR